MMVIITKQSTFQNKFLDPVLIPQNSVARIPVFLNEPASSVPNIDHCLCCLLQIHFVSHVKNA